MDTVYTQEKPCTFRNVGVWLPTILPKMENLRTCQGRCTSIPWQKLLFQEVNPGAAGLDKVLTHQVMDATDFEQNMQIILLLFPLDSDKECKIHEGKELHHIRIEISKASGEMESQRACVFPTGGGRHPLRCKR
jgi:hypothetical protein